MTTTHPNPPGGPISASSDSTAASASTSGSGVATSPGEALSGLAAWVTTSDHKRIGRMFIGGGLMALLGAAVVGVLLGFERLDSTDTTLNQDAIPQLFAAFRVVLVFGAAAPLLLGIAIAVVPLQIGARSLAFPRLALGGLWTWVVGLALVVVALVNNGGPGGGEGNMVDLYLAAQGLLLIGLTAAAGAVVVTVLTARAPGLTMSRVPLFSWSALVGGLSLIMSLPVLLGVLTYLFVDHRSGTMAFEGNVGIEKWTAFLFGVPAVAIVAIPAIGIGAELFPVTFRRPLPLRGPVFAGLGLVGVAGLSAVTQQTTHVVDWAGDGLSFDNFGDTFETLLPYAWFTLLPILGVLVVLAGTGIVAPRSRPRINAPFVFGFLGVDLILAGMVGGAISPIADLELTGTVFPEGALVCVVYGTVLCGLGGVAYWAPKWWGRTLPNGPLFGLALLGALGAALASLPYYIAGFADQPGNAVSYTEYDGPAELWNGLVLVGHAVMAVVVLGFIGLAMRTFTGSGERSGDNPWGGHTLEWATTSPAPPHNFADIPTVASAEPMLDLEDAGRESDTASNGSAE